MKSFFGSLRSSELETSTSWRITAPLRMIVQGSRSIVPSVKARVEWCRRVLVFTLSLWPRWLAYVARRDKRRLAWRSRDAERTPFIVGTDELASLPRVPLSFRRAIDRLFLSYPHLRRTHVTRRCLASLAEQATETAFEVLVVDDAFAEPLNLASMHVSGAQLIRNKSGFPAHLQSRCGRGAGRYILLLNNDTFVHAGAVNALLEAAHFDNVGAVCAQLRFADGRLQEAGGIVWSDGSAWNWGRGEHPKTPSSIIRGKWTTVRLLP